MLSPFTMRRLSNVLGDQAANEINTALSRAGSGPAMESSPEVGDVTVGGTGEATAKVDDETQVLIPADSAAADAVAKSAGDSEDETPGECE